MVPRGVPRICGPRLARRGDAASPERLAQRLAAWSGCQPLVAQNSSRITAFAPFDSDWYRLATDLLTASRWLIVSPMSEAVPTDREGAPLRAHSFMRQRDRFRGHLW